MHTLIIMEWHWAESSYLSKFCAETSLYHLTASHSQAFIVSSFNHFKSAGVPLYAPVEKPIANHHAMDTTCIWLFWMLSLEMNAVSFYIFPLFLASTKVFMNRWCYFTCYFWPQVWFYEMKYKHFILYTYVTFTAVSSSLKVFIAFALNK